VAGHSRSRQRPGNHARWPTSGWFALDTVKPASSTPLSQRRRSIPMVSLNTLEAIAGPTGEAQAPGCRRYRRDWVRGEVRCLMCARLIGRVLGSRDADQCGQRASGGHVSFFAYRSTDAGRSIVAFTPLVRLRCAECGGTGALDEVDFFSTYDEPPVKADEYEAAHRGPGRPPRRMNRAHTPPGGLAVALAELADRV
jgi:hypothetical protein